jgi:hypothetical protein
MSRKSIAIIMGLAALGVLSVSRWSMRQKTYAAEDPQVANAEKMIHEGRQTFRFDTFGDEAFWGGTLKLHEAIEGKGFGGVALASLPGKLFRSA